MFEVVEQGPFVGAYEMRGTGRCTGRTAVLLGPEARDRAYAYARWLNAVAGRQRRWGNPSFRGGTDPER
jgi:hypothetical protein